MWLCIIFTMGLSGCGSALINLPRPKKELNTRVYKCSFSDKKEHNELWVSVVIKVSGALIDVSNSAGLGSDRIELKARCSESYIN